MLPMYLLLAIPASVVLIVLVWSIKERFEKKRPIYVTQEGRFRKYLIPKSFWDDINKIEIAIWEMGYDELDHVVFLIDQFCDKYGEISDHNVFRTRVANMLTRYQERKKWIMSKKVFNHQNQ